MDDFYWYLSRSSRSLHWAREPDRVLLPLLDTPFGRAIGDQVGSKMRKRLHEESQSEGDGPVTMKKEESSKKRVPKAIAIEPGKLR